MPGGKPNTWKRDKGCCGMEGTMSLHVDDETFTIEETYGFCCPTRLDSSAYLVDVNFVEAYSPKKKIVAYLLWLFLGCFGAHRFYVGKWKSGILMALTLGGGLLFWLTDLCRIGSWLESARVFVGIGSRTLDFKVKNDHQTEVKESLVVNQRPYKVGNAYQPMPMPQVQGYPPNGYPSNVHPQNGYPTNGYPNGYPPNSLVHVV